MIIKDMVKPDFLNIRTSIQTYDQLLEYLSQVEQKTYDHLDTLTDDMLYECPEKCERTRLELSCCTGHMPVRAIMNRLVFIRIPFGSNYAAESRTLTQKFENITILT